MANPLAAKPLETPTSKPWQHRPFVAVLFAGATSVLLLCVAFALLGVAPFGDKTFAAGDAVRYLYAARNGDGLFYSTSFAMGVNFWAVVVETLVSPFNLLALILPAGNIALLGGLLVLCKVALGAMAATGFFAGRNSPLYVGSVQAAALGLLYAFGGFTVLNAATPEMLDMLYLLPLLSFAIGRLHNKGFFLYALCVAACIACAMQQAVVLLCVVALCAAVYMFVCKDKAVAGRIAARLCGGAAVGAMLAAPVWLPYFIKNNSAATGGAAYAAQFDALTPFTGLSATLPAILCTGLVLGCLVLVVWGGMWKETAIRFTLLCFGLCLLPLVFAPIGTQWNGGTEGLSYGYISLWAGLLLGAAALQTLRRRPQPQTQKWLAKVVAVVALVVFVAVCVYLVMAGGNSFKWMLFTAVLLCTATFSIASMRASMDLRRGTFALCILALAVVQSGYSALVYIAPAASGYTSIFQSEEISALSAGKRVKISRGSYGDNATSPSVDDLGAAGGKTLATSGGMLREETLNAYKKLGYSGYGQELSGYGGTLLSDVFLNVGAEVSVLPPSQAAALSSVPTGYVIENTAVQPGGWAVVAAQGLNSLTALPEGDRYDAQDFLWQAVYGGEDTLLQRYEPTHTQGVNYEVYEYQADRYGVWQQNDDVTGLLVYDIEIGERETLYFDCFRFVSADLDEVVNDGLGVSVNGQRLEELYPVRQSNGILCLGTFEEETVRVEIDLWRSELVRSFGVAGIRHSDVEAAVAAANTPPVSLQNGNADAALVANAGDVLVLALAYDEGFSATVNGKAAMVHKVLDGFIAVELETGENNVQLRYSPPGLWAGVVVCITGAALLLLYLFLRRRPVVLRWDESETAVFVGKLCRVLLLCAGVAAIVILYAMPFAVWAERGLLTR